MFTSMFTFARLCSRFLLRFDGCFSGCPRFVGVHVLCTFYHVLHVLFCSERQRECAWQHGYFDRKAAGRLSVNLSRDFNPTLDPDTVASQPLYPGTALRNSEPCPEEECGERQSALALNYKGVHESVGHGGVRAEEEPPSIAPRIAYKAACSPEGSPLHRHVKLGKGVAPEAFDYSGGIGGCPDSCLQSRPDSGRYVSVESDARDKNKIAPFLTKRTEIDAADLPSQSNTKSGDRIERNIKFPRNHVRGSSRQDCYRKWRRRHGGRNLVERSVSAADCKEIRGSIKKFPCEKSGMAGTGSREQLRLPARRMATLKMVLYNSVCTASPGSRICNYRELHLWHGYGTGTADSAADRLQSLKAAQRKVEAAGELKQVQIVGKDAGTVAAQVEPQPQRARDPGELQSSAVVIGEPGSDRQV